MTNPTTNSNVATSISAASLASMLSASNMIVNEHSIRFNVTGKAEGRTQKFGFDGDDGQAAAVLNALTYAVAQIYKLNGSFFFGSSNVNSLEDFQNTRIVSVDTSDYVMGGAELRNLIAAGEIKYTSTIVKGDFYRLLQEGSRTLIHHLTAVYQGEDVYMNENDKHDMNARKLLEGYDLILSAIRAGLNITIMFGNSEFVARDLIAAIRSEDPMASARAIISKKRSTSRFNRSINNALFVQQEENQEKYADSNVRIATRVAKFDADTKNGGLTAEGIVGQVVNAYAYSDATKTPKFRTVIIDSKEYKGTIIDSIEVANATIDACEQMGWVLYIA